MTSRYPVILTVVILSTAVTAASAGLAVSDASPASDGESSGINLGDGGLIGNDSAEAVCTYSQAANQATVIDETVTATGGDEVRFGFTVPENNAALKLDFQALTVTVPQVIVTGPKNNTLLQLPVTEVSDRSITNAKPGSYQIRLINENRRSSDVSIEVRLGVC